MADIDVTIEDNSTLIEADVIYIGTKGDKGDPYTESEEFEALAAQVRADAQSASAAVSEVDEKIDTRVKNIISIDGEMVIFTTQS